MFYVGYTKALEGGTLPQLRLCGVTVPASLMCRNAGQQQNQKREVTFTEYPRKVLLSIVSIFCCYYLISIIYTIIFMIARDVDKKVW